MSDKYDEMADLTDWQVTEKTLRMMGYNDESCWGSPGHWKKGDQFWDIHDIVGTVYAHVFTAEVIGSLIEDKEKTWAYCDQCIGSRCKVGFYHWPYEDDAKYVSYDNIAARPRAVCEAVLWAVAAEKEAESDA